MIEKIKTGYSRITDIANIIRDPGLEKLQRLKGFDEIDRLFKTAAGRGTAIHYFAELIAKGKLSEITRLGLTKNEYNIYDQVNEYEAWFNGNITKIKLTEKRIYDPHLKITGRPDLIAMNNKKLTLFDLKTGTDIYFSAYIQMGGYMHLLKIKKIKIQAVKIIHLNQKLKIIDLTKNMADLLTCFYAVQAIYTLRKKLL